jgi:hypothetical protein
MDDHPRLPTFVIIGAQKSGTTSLARYLSGHPQVFMSAEKEIHFFETRKLYERGADWYARHFAQAADAAAVGEASPAYMYFPLVPERMAQVVPDCRLIAILRDPIDRAYSHYWMNRALGLEDLEFPDAVEREAARLASGDMPSLRRYSYFDRGRYLEQLMRFTPFFGRDRLLVLLFDDLRERPDEVFVEVCRFLAVNSAYRPADLGRAENQHTEFKSIRLRNVAKRGFPNRVNNLIGRVNAVPARYPPLDPALKSELSRLFEDDNRRLAAWLGRDLRGWEAVSETRRSGIAADRS